MDKRWLEVTRGEEGNALLPFFWMHNGHHDELPVLIQQIYDSGARALCVESRPFEGFGEQLWWDDMDVIVSECKNRGMKVWILDDKHFPTGYANGLVEKKYPNLKRWQLVEDHVDVIGPAPESSVLLNEENEDHQLIAVYAYKRNGHAETLENSPIDLTANVKGRYLYWSVPHGAYRIVALYKSRKGTSAPSNIHMIDSQSVHVLIEAVYESHYAHYADEFGKTIAGFFSDEPSFGNCNLQRGGLDRGMYEKTLGQIGLALPWSEEVLRRMNAEIGRDCMPLLAGLWFTLGDGVPDVRIAYMNAVTRLWEENFSYQLGDWCRAHNVEYIGHIIEDMDAHMRLGCSGGHYFRSLAGQDMAGIDVVLHQIMPGFADEIHTSILSGGIADPWFFDYVLTRLAASLSHIEPRMRNRAMCEVFGAYGWAEGVPFMKHLMDHMLVRGINRFVPHAFSPDYPDPDCPPHFGGGGDNPEFKPFAALMKYTNQTVHLIEGTEIVSAALAYSAEAEWSGKPCMSLREPAKTLYNAQLNYDILPWDALIERVHVEDGVLCMGEMRYSALLIPGAAYLPLTCRNRIATLEAEGAKIAFLGTRCADCDAGRVIEVAEAPDFVRACGGTDVSLEKPFPLMRIRHARRENCDVFMLVNESMSDVFDGVVHLPVEGSGLRIDLQLNASAAISAENGNVHLTLGFGQSVILMFGAEEAQLTPMPEANRAEPLNSVWNYSSKAAHSGKAYSENKPLESLYNITGMQGDPTFSGYMRYETAFTVDEAAVGIDFGQVGECMHVTLDGRELGWRMDAPYRYFPQDGIPAGKHKLTVEVVNTLVYQQPDRFSHYMQIPPSGLLGPVTLLYQ